jgi:hypothetical protein
LLPNVSTALVRSVSKGELMAQGRPSPRLKGIGARSAFGSPKVIPVVAEGCVRTLLQPSALCNVQRNLHRYFQL